MSIDCIILAGGKGSRLNGLAAKYHKPLLVVNGKPLIRNAVLAAEEFVDHIFVVVAPANAMPICDVLEDLDCTVLVQRKANGPGDALLTAARLSTAEKILVLMADNVLTMHDVKRVLDSGYAAAGTRLMSPDEAARFTWYSESTQSWVEKSAPVGLDAHGDVVCWVGPLVINRMQCVEVLVANRSEGELLIGPYLTKMGVDTGVTVDTYDIGTLEMWE